MGAEHSRCLRGSRGSTSLCARCAFPAHARGGCKGKRTKIVLNSKTMLTDKLCFAAVWAVIGSSIPPMCPASCPMRGCPSCAPTFRVLW